MSRHNSIDALRERYQRSRLQQPDPVVGTVLEEEEEEEEEQEEEEVEDDDYSMCSSSSSIPDENINFDLVYALHTFVATVDGQASVVKGDAMTLLDDTNSYWWLIRALKASEVGYIPAENIETPFERLARLNKHRNVQVTSLDQLQHYGPVSTSTRSKNKNKVKVSKQLACQLQIILTDDDDGEVYEELFEKWDEPMETAEEEDAESFHQQSSPENNTPLLNPEFNKPINIVDKPLPVRVATPPLIQFDQPKDFTPVQDPVVEDVVPKKVTGLKRLLSIGNGASKRKSVEPVVVHKEDDEQYHVLRIFSGNINVSAMFNTVAVTPEMNADQLLKLALQKFHIPLLETSKRPTSLQNGIEYYLTVKSMDGDEITLEPQDKPLAIFESLSDHLTTPMPSLTYIKRLSIEQPTIKVTRVGVSKARQRAKARFGEDSVIRFSLHKRIKRTIDTAAGQIHVKISYYADNKQFVASSAKLSTTMGLIRKSSLLRVDQHIQQQQHQWNEKAAQERIDKLVAISTTTLISDLTLTALEKFHLVDQDKTLYGMALSLNGQETPLMPTRTISDILNDSDLIPKGTVEKLFVLRKKNTTVIPSESESTNRFVRYILKQQQDAPENTTPSSTGSVLKRLDQAILSLENDKRQLDKFQYNGSSPPPMNRNHSQGITSTTSRIVPVRSNSLSSITHRNKDVDNKHPPTRSSSLKISGDVFDNSVSPSLSNMDDLELELQRIATSQ